MTSFSDLLQLHRQLDDLFLKHQRALLRLNLQRALETFDQYERELLSHIRDEEDLMIPLYRERATAPVGGAPDIFLGEHEKLRQFLVLIREELNRLTIVDDLERGVLFLIDSEHLFKRLLVHHDTREKKMLYPLLDGVTTETERKDIFKQLQLSPGRKSRSRWSSIEVTQFG
jgi:hemerythrin superfamily protein